MYPSQTPLGDPLTSFFFLWMFLIIFQSLIKKSRNYHNSLPIFFLEKPPFLPPLLSGKYCIKFTCLALPEFSSYAIFENIYTNGTPIPTFSQNQTKFWAILPRYSHTTVYAAHFYCGSLWFCISYSSMLNIHYSND